MKDERDLPFETGTSKQGFASPKFTREYRQDAGRKGQQARQERMSNVLAGAVAEARRRAAQEGKTPEEVEAAGKEAALKTKVWSGGFKKGDPYTKVMARFAINERWRKYYEQKAQKLEGTLDFDRDAYAKRIETAQDDVEKYIVPAKEEAKSLSRYLRKAQGEVGRVGGLVERIQSRIDLIRRSAANAPPGQMWLPYEIRKGQIPLPIGFPPMPRAPWEKPSTEDEQVKQISETLGIDVEGVERTGEASRRVAQELAEMLEPTGELPLEEVEEEKIEQVVSEVETPSRRAGKKRELTEDEREFVSNYPGFSDLSDRQQRYKLDRYRKGKLQTPSKPAEKVQEKKEPAKEESKALLDPQQEAFLRGRGPIPSAALPKKKTERQKEAATDIMSMLGRGAKKGESEKKSETSIAPSMESMTAAAVLVAIVGNTFGNAASIARWIEDRAREYREGRRNPMTIDPKVSSSPAVRRALLEASKRYFF